MRDGVPETCTKMFDMSIQEINGKGPKKRKKSLEPSCDIDGRSVESGENDKEVSGVKNGGGIKEGSNEGFSFAEKEKSVELLHWRDMPQHLQFNPYVLTGYRPLQSFGGCVRSLFYFHNETINILTHGVSLLYMMAVLPGLLPWGGGEGGTAAWFLSLCHLLGALAPWCGSFLYHLFMNHTHGARLYHRLLQLDMLGIWVSQSIGAIPMVTATVYCAPMVLRYLALAVYCLGSLLGLYKAMRAWSPWERRLCFAAPFCMRLFLAAARAARLGGGDPHAILHVFLQLKLDYKTRSVNELSAVRLQPGEQLRRGVSRRRCDRSAAYTREVVPGHRGPLPQLTQHHARASCAGCLLHAPGDNTRPGVDGARGLRPALTPRCRQAGADPATHICDHSLFIYLRFCSSEITARMTVDGLFALRWIFEIILTIRTIS